MPLACTNAPGPSAFAAEPLAIAGLHCERSSVRRTTQRPGDGGGDPWICAAPRARRRRVARRGTITPRTAPKTLC
eukprot:gene4130-17912_t